MDLQTNLPLVFQHHPMEGWGVWGFGWIPLLIWLVLFLIIGILVYQDAEKRGMNGLLWLVLILIPMVGLLFLLIYIVVREEKPGTRNAVEILDERLAKGEITQEEYEELKDKLK
ncbi:SHOCT domain-containing protein [Methanonatronarchaeum sp. AMET6-2]|uniref:SHOCT domain-containing protein n=1 Tax=Methanonatronarchaeum sp. AMET6-2 TaxID=2933293 RepID=UPI001FF0DFA0|nr:SHOCT domain-containing protein [Methanonatronarchaeum sp. AMET6-2]UOY09541.1 SHOCT domain-containing protein [Methanonatronarchaeum sp. AMET6-2]